MTEKPKPPKKPKRQPRATKAPLTKAKVAKALRANFGVQVRAAEALRVDRSTICLWVKAHPDLRQIIDEMIPDIVDAAKDNVVVLMDSADEGVKLRASSKVIDTYGARFGLGARQHFHSAPDGGPVRVDMSGLSDEELELARQLRLKLAAAAGPDRGGAGTPQG